MTDELPTLADARPLTEREYLLRAICAAPLDDAPRLAYADWCDENSHEERAEFIRLQLGIDSRLKASQAELKEVRQQLGHCRCRPLNPGRCAICVAQSRFNELNDYPKQSRHRRQWDLFILKSSDWDDLGGLTEPKLAATLSGLTFCEQLAGFAMLQRGFLHTIRVASSYWEGNHPWLVQQFPIEAVTLTTDPPARPNRTDVLDRSDIRRADNEFCAQWAAGWPTIKFTFPPRYYEFGEIRNG